ncbi:hypothetical protein GRH90_07540 [Enterobacteriales bacterium SAP-6]|uniref:Flagellar hook-length control protein-like C-terminal domain-containing protein n=2 Tax=Acerihabitans arboris TaxID=2691583 RepID=A0A845SMY6_9GAMM|nr:hypothetical protein [Acerihabitans arboris]
MALLAQTRPAAANASAAGIAGAVDATPVAGTDAGNIASLAAGAGNVGANAIAAETLVAVVATDSADTALPLSDPLVQDDAFSQAGDLLTLGLKTAAPAAAATIKSAPATPDKGLLPHADATQSPAAANPILVSQTTNATDDFSDPSVDTTLILKKTTGLMLDAPASTVGVTPAATPTLSAADTGVTTTATPATALISAQLGSDEWRQAIGQQVLMQVRNGQQNAELRLHPDNLGALQISLRMDGNNQAQIHLASGHSQVRSALEDALPQLRAALAESGISLGQSSVGSETTPNWGGTGQDSANNARTASGFAIDAQTVIADDAVAPASTAAGIDTFA